MLKRWLDGTWTDFRLAVRALVRMPAFTLFAAAVLAVGIGGTGTIFTLVNAFMLRPLPVRDGAALVMISVAREGDRWHALSYPDYLDYRDQDDGFAAMTGYTLDRVGLSTESWADPIVATYVPGNFFGVLGVPPALGRVFVDHEGSRAGADPIVVLGYDYWRDRFGADPDIIGRVVRINGEPFTVVGVAQQGFAGPYSAAVIDAYLPFGMRGQRETPPAVEDRGNRRLRVLARLAEGVSLKEAQSSLDVIASRLAAEYPETNEGVRARVTLETRTRPDPENADSLPSAVGILMVLVGLLLMTACFNVANMLAARAIDDDRQLAIRAALGASRGRILRQLLSESVSIAMLGGLLGGLLASWIARWLSAAHIPGIPARFDFSLDGRVYALIALSSLVAGLVAGLVPSWRASRAGFQSRLASASRGDRTGAPRHRLRNALVAIQIAACLTLLVISGLFVKSLAESRSLDLGFDREDLLVLSLDPSHYGYEQRDTRALYRDLLEQTRSLAGVTSVAHASSVPLGYTSRSTRVGPEGHVFTPDDRGLRAGYNIVSSQYFRTLGIPLLRGRLLTSIDDEDGAPVAVINEAMADALWPGLDPLGRRFERIIANGNQPPELVEVVGVVPNGKYFFLFEATTPFFYLPFDQSYAALQTLLVRSPEAPETLATTLRDIVHRNAPDVPVTGLMTMEESLMGGNGFLLPMLGASLASALGALALLLATVGLYGVVSYTAKTRTREIGIRMAIGASGRDILRMMVHQGLGLTLAGVALGLTATLALARFVGALLVATTPTDPLVYATMSLFLVLVALIASLVPARRAARADPVAGLRQD